MKKGILLSLIFASGLSVGALGTHLIKEKNQDRIQATSSLYENFFDNKFLRGETTPFEQMEKISIGIEGFQAEEFSEFEHWYSEKFGGTINEIKQEEDEKFIYYRLDLDGLNKDSVKIYVSGGQLNISGSMSKIQAQEDPSEVSTEGSEFYQSFERKFPVPMGVDSTKVDFKAEGNQIIIQFPKIPDVNKV